jgi:hypothetical protein
MMNERIRELYQQAHMVREYPADDPWRGGNPATVYWGGERSAEKFAELIVQECADRVSKMVMRDKFDFIPQDPHSQGWNDAVEYASKELKKSLRVE